MLGPTEGYAGELSVFSLCFMYTRLKAEEVSNIETPMDTEKKASNKRLLSLVKEPGKGQPSKTKNL